jgi:hypothetical protein
MSVTRSIRSCAGEALVLTGEGNRWVLACGEDDVALFEITYRARVQHVETADGTWWFEMPRGSRIVARQDTKLATDATYEPRFRGGAISIAGGQAVRLRPPSLRRNHWRIQTGRFVVMTVCAHRGQYSAALTAEAAVLDPLPLVVTLSLAAVVLESSVPPPAPTPSGPA